MYSYLVVFQYLQTKFDLCSFNNNIYNIIGNTYVDTNTEIEEWTWKDYKDLRKKIAESLCDEKTSYTENDIIILNMIKKKVENESKENVLS